MTSFTDEIRAKLAAMRSMSYEQLQEAGYPFDCDHAEVTVLLYEKSNQAVCAAEFCNRCAKKIREVKKAPYIGRARSVDADARERYEAELTQLRKEFHEIRIAAFESKRGVVPSDLWWAAYKNFLASDQWRRIRSAVLDRDNHTCQGCLKSHENGARLQVHHKTYRRVSKELLIDLVTLCEDCHEWLHESRESSHDQRFVEEWINRVSSMEVPF